MCSRFAQDEKAYRWAQEQTNMSNLLQLPPPNFNVAPTQEVIAVRTTEDGPREVVSLRWGLIPNWSEEPPKSPLINARAERVATAPSYRSAFKQRRCIVPATAFYEWRTEGEDAKGKPIKQPFAVRPVDGDLFLFPGLWEEWRGTQTLTILTTEANLRMADIHDRMPVIFTQDSADLWLKPETPADALTALLRPVESELVRLYPVTRAMNSVKGNDPSFLEPVQLG
jgi:putative SOS response-associated peptidase YedK